jgi:hypothetical protein
MAADKATANNFIFIPIPLPTFIDESGRPATSGQPAPARKRPGATKIHLDVRLRCGFDIRDPLRAIQFAANASREH